MSKEEIKEEEIQEESQENEEVTEEAEAPEDTPENELEALQKELAELKDTYARVHADFENIKKRL